MAKRNKNHRPGDGSSGPKTDTGKERCSRNATTHGARSENHVILPNESAEDYEKIRRHYLSDLPPLNDLEKSLVERIAQREWHLRRCERLHDQAHTGALLNNPDPREWSPAEIKHIDLMLRYRNAADRAWRAAVKDVKDLRKHRLEMLHLTEKSKRLYYENLRDGVSTPKPAPDSPDQNDEHKEPPHVQKPQTKAETEQPPRPEPRPRGGNDDQADDEWLDKPRNPS